MRQWLKANGGPPAVIVVGAGLAFAFWPLGVALIVIGAAMWLYSWRRFPFAIVRRKPAQTADADAALVARTKNAVAALGKLFSEHALYEPISSFPPPMPSTEEERDRTFAESSRRSREHEQKTVARFFEDHYAEVVDLTAKLHHRHALTNREAKNIEWGINGRSLHFLPAIGPALNKGAHRLETGQIPANEEENPNAF